MFWVFPASMPLMVKMSSVAVGVVCIAFLAAMTLNPILHSFIPHTHHDGNHEGTESPVWTSLHAALRHEDKKILLFLLALLSIGTLQVFRFCVQETASLVTAVSDVRARIIRAQSFLAGRWLIRGISPYRRFA